MWNVFILSRDEDLYNECGREEELMRRKGEGVVDMGNKIKA